MQGIYIRIGGSRQKKCRQNKERVGERGADPLKAKYFKIVAASSIGACSQP